MFLSVLAPRKVIWEQSTGTFASHRLYFTHGRRAGIGGKEETVREAGPLMARVLVNVMASDWAVHFIGSDGRTRIGPWLLLDSHDEVRAILRWGNVSAAELEEHESSIRRWNVSSVSLDLTERQMAALIERGRCWPWNGHELGLMKQAGKYPPARLTLRGVRQRFGT